MIQRLAVGASALTILAASVAADGQFGPEWVRIAYCNPRLEGSHNRMPAGQAEVARLAQSATQVKICDYNSSVDCITSNVGTFPIQNLRDRVNLLSHQNGGDTPCDGTCVSETWTGPHQRMMQLPTTCGDRAHDAMQHPDGAWMYWACGNTEGIHFGMPQGPCAWTHRGLPTGLEIFIDAYSASPTSAPTRYPTRWFESTEHQSNTTELQARVTALEISLRAATDLMNTATAARSTMQSEIVELTSSRNTLRDQVAQLTANSTALMAALSGAAAAVRRPGSTNREPPSINADGTDIVIGAPAGTVRLQGASCGADLCDSTGFADRLQRALQDLV